MTPAVVTVLAPGPLTTVQDQGRPGRSHWGVGRSGAADRASAALANRLLANRPSAALLEVTLGGLALRAESAVTVAVTGAPAPVEVDSSPVPLGAPLALAPGSVLRLGRPATGLRTYLAIRGGFDVPPVLGSRSYDVLARLGPPPLTSGDRLAVGPAPRAWPAVDVVAPVVRPDGVVELTGSVGPHLDALAPRAARSLTAPGRLALWSVAQDSDRTGLRLDGEPLARREEVEWPPEGLVRGAVQVPPAGRPVVLLADHPVTGGYPAVGALDERSCDLAAQLRPGDQVRLRLG
jgi:biotin-dependent carboxylase-like uncharacterized protein